MILLAIALFGLMVPNGLFVYWLFQEFGGVQDVLSNHLALGFILDAFLAMGLLAYLFARRPVGPVRWPWFIGFSIAGGLGFAIPFFLWLNHRLSADRDRGFVAWWSSR